MTALFALLIALFAMVAATFAWYVYNTGAHTTKVRMAAGASASLQISNDYDEGYSSSAVLKEFNGFLNPVSTDRIAGGFQKVLGFTNGTENQPNLVANLFGPAQEHSDYHKASLFLKTNGSTLKVYLADIGYKDSDDNNPISTAIRVGIIPHEPGKGKPALGEYIFAINEDPNLPFQEYNTASGEEGHVLDSSKTDGSTVDFRDKLYTPRNYCNYDRETGTVTPTDNSVALCTVQGDGTGDYGEPVELEIYIWLEGCDQDCTQNLCNTTLENLALSFAGFAESTNQNQ